MSKMGSTFKAESLNFSENTASFISGDASAYPTKSSYDVDNYMRSFVAFGRRGKHLGNDTNNDSLKQPGVTKKGDGRTAKPRGKIPKKDSLKLPSAIDPLHTKLTEAKNIPKPQELRNRSHVPQPSSEYYLPHLFYDRLKKGSPQKKAPTAFDKFQASTALKKALAEYEEQRLKEEKEIVKPKPLPKNFKCGVCKQEFVVKAILDAHKLQAHSNSGVKNEVGASKPPKTCFRCQYCGREFDLQKTLQMHQSRHCTRISDFTRKTVEDPFFSHVKKPPLPRLGKVSSIANLNDGKYDLYHLIAKERNDRIDAAKAKKNQNMVSSLQKELAKQGYAVTKKKSFFSEIVKRNEKTAQSSRW